MLPADRYVVSGSVICVPYLKPIVFHATVNFDLRSEELRSRIRAVDIWSRYRVKVQTFDTGQFVQTGFIAITTIAYTAVPTKKATTSQRRRLSMHTLPDDFDVIGSGRVRWRSASEP